MREYIRKRVVDVSSYILESKATVRKAAAVQPLMMRPHDAQDVGGFMGQRGEHPLPQGRMLRDLA